MSSGLENGEGLTDCQSDNGGLKRPQQHPLTHRRSHLNLRGGLEITLWKS